MVLSDTAKRNQAQERKGFKLRKEDSSSGKKKIQAQEGRGFVQAQEKRSFKLRKEYKLKESRRKTTTPPVYFQPFQGNLNLTWFYFIIFFSRPQMGGRVGGQ